MNHEITNLPLEDDRVAEAIFACIMAAAEEIGMECVVGFFQGFKEPIDSFKLAA